MLNFQFSYPFYTRLKYDRSSRRRLGVQLHCSGFHFYHRVQLPHLGQRLSVIIKWGKGLSAETRSLRAKREHENIEDHFSIAVREHSDTGADEDVDDRPIVGYLQTLFHWWSLRWGWRAMHKWVRGRLHCKGQYRVLSHLRCRHNISITLKQVTCEIFLLSI